MRRAFSLVELLTVTALIMINSEGAWDGRSIL